MVETRQEVTRRGTARRRVRSATALLAFVGALLPAGCGNFWQNPYTTSGSGGTTTSSVTLTADPTSVAVGATVTLTATVSPAAATGTVTFYNGSTSLGSATLSSGTASTTTTFASAGTESLTASYSGDDTYESSTSDAVTVTVTATAAGSAIANKLTANTQQATANATAPPVVGMLETDPYEASGRTFAASDGEAAIAERDGAVTLTGATLSGAGGNGRGVLLYQPAAVGKATVSFTMTDGSLSYSCDAAAKPACTAGSTKKGQSNPATVFAVADAKAEIALNDVKVTNETATAASAEGTLLTAASRALWGKAGANGGQVVFRAEGTALKGDVIVDGVSTAEIALTADGTGTGSALTGAVDGAGTGKRVTLTLDSASLWTVTGTSHVTDVSGLAIADGTVSNIDGGGHCVYYAGTVNGETGAGIYALSGGGYLAPRGTTGLACQ